MQREEAHIDIVRFAVNETPYCFWDLDARQRNLDFINTIDPLYFQHIANLHSEALDGEEKQYAAAALRVAYSHGLESLFALLCAAVQAPDCIIGWLLKYQIVELREVVKKISERRRIYSKLRAKPVTWSVVADMVFTYFRTGDDDKDAKIRANFSKLWRRLASDFLQDNHTYEYNSIKHGLRARMGGFYFAMGAEEVPGVPAPPEKMRMMVDSTFGSSFYVPVRLQDRHNFAVRQQSVNWDPTNFAYALQLIALSIKNVTGFLKILHGIPIKEVPFSFCENDETYDEPWKRQLSISSFGMNSQISPEGVSPVSIEEILDVYNQTEDDETNQNHK